MLFTSIDPTLSLSSLLLLSSLSSSVLGVPGGKSEWQEMKKTVGYAVGEADATTRKHFSAMDRHLEALEPGERSKAINDPKVQSIYKNPSGGQKAQRKAQVVRDNRLQEWKKLYVNRGNRYRADKVDAYRKLNGYIEDYSYAYPLDHLKGDGSGSDTTHLENLKSAVDYQKGLIKGMQDPTKKSSVNKDSKQ